MLKQIKDWKFAASTLIAVAALLAGSLIPYFLWKMDLQSKSISLKVLSSVEIQPTSTVIDGLKMTFEGKEINHPTLTTLEITNDGAKPIPATDFESPVTLFSDPNTEIIRVQIAEKKPAELPAQIKNDQNAVVLSPLLLNPADSIKIVLITTGASPVFKPSARIAGVTEIAVKNAQSRPLPKRAFLIIVIIGCYIIYMLSAFHYFFPRSPGVLKKSVGIISAIAGLNAGLGINLLLSEFDVVIDIPGWVVIVIVAACIISIYILWRLLKHFEAKIHLLEQRKNRLAAK